MNVAIIGSGYVGLTTGVCLAELGHAVTCIDNNADKLKILKRGASPIFEPGLEDLIRRNRGNGRLLFAAVIGPAVKQADIVFICVNTPPRQDGQADLRYVEQVTKEVAVALSGAYTVIVDKSTVPVKTAEKVEETLVRYGADRSKFDVVSNPEFLREGTAVRDTLEPDRIVIGSASERATARMLELYKPIIDRTNAPVKVVSVRSAELIKHGANALLAMKISFANTMAHVCEAVRADALEVLDAIGLDERIGVRFLRPGIGFGGSCFPKDIAAFKKILEAHGISNALICAIEEINAAACQRFCGKIEKELWVLDNKTIGVLGLSFKPDTDDVRNSPALSVITELKAKGARVKAYDPQAMARAKKELPDVEYCKDPYRTAEGSEALVICTEWNEFKACDFGRIKEKMAVPIIFDGRNILNGAALKEMGFKYFGVGR